MTVVRHVIVGPAQHGVVIAARRVATGEPVTVATADDVRARDLDDADMVHLHFTEPLFGNTTEEAAENFVRLVGRLPCPATVTLHDLPLRPDLQARWERRTASYARVVSAVAGVVVSSHHEATAVPAGPPCAVIPLPLDRLEPALTPPQRVQPIVGILGWIYPGKGHELILDRLPAGWTLLALGGVSPGHRDLLDEVHETGGARFRHTGWLPDDELRSAVRSVAVPVSAHAQLSASGSIGTWLELGRRPLVADGPWVRELLERCPGTVIPVAPDGWRSAIAAAARQPRTTWLGPIAIGPGQRQCAASLQDFCESVAC